MREGQDYIRRLTGDGLYVKMNSNHRVLEVTGDGCKIIMAKNSGSVRVVGDGCQVKVTHNVGDIVYTGDGGRVLLGPKSSKERVKYVGDGGKVSFDPEPKRRSSGLGKEEKREGKRETSGPKSSSIIKNYLGMNTEGKRNAYEKISPEVRNNLSNERKEEKDPNGGKDEKNARNTRNRIVFVTTTSVTSKNEPKDSYGVEKWFVAPSKIVRSSGNNMATVTVRENSSTTSSRN